MITVHHLDNSRSHRILWLLEELEVPYTIESYLRDPETMRAPVSLREVHPLGKAPVVSLPGGEVLAESGAIIETLVEEHGPELKPEAGTEEARRYRFYMHWAEGSMMAPLLVKLVFAKLRTAKLPFFIKPIARKIADTVDATFTDGEIHSHLSFLNQELASRDFCTGEAFTAADVQLFFPIEAAEARADLGAYPNVAAYLERLRARPAYARAIEKGGELELGK